MPNPKVGGALFEGISELFSGPLGVVKIGFEGYDLGKTTADSELTPDQDIKDIIYQQNGTKASDHTRTGIDYMLAVTFGEIKTGLLTRLMAGITTANTSALDDDGTISRQLYQSMRTLEAGGLRIVSVDEDGIASEDDQNIINMYEAIPIIDGSLINWGADTQRGLTVNFRIKWHEFATGESSTKNGAFGYWGDPTAEDVPAITWPNVSAPAFVSADAALATTVAITFDEDVAFFGGGAFVADSMWITVDDGSSIIAVLPSSAAIASAVVTLTMPAATIASGDIVKVFWTANAVEDTETTANVSDALYGGAVTDSI